MEVIYFWELPSIPKTIEQFDTFVELLPVVIFDAELKSNTSDKLVLFDEVAI